METKKDGRNNFSRLKHSNKTYQLIAFSVLSPERFAQCALHLRHPPLRGILQSAVHIRSRPICSAVRTPNPCKCYSFGKARLSPGYINLHIFNLPYYLITVRNYCQL